MENPRRIDLPVQRERQGQNPSHFHFLRPQPKFIEMVTLKRKSTHIKTIRPLCTCKLKFAIIIVGLDFHPTGFDLRPPFCQKFNRDFLAFFDLLRYSELRVENNIFFKVRCFKRENTSISNLDAVENPRRIGLDAQLLARSSLFHKYPKIST